MKKSFPLELPNRKPARVVDAIKNDVRKYVKRERRKELPEGVDFCDFDCRTGQDVESAETAHLTEITERIDHAVKEGWSAIYIEILAKGGYRSKREVEPISDESSVPDEAPTEQFDDFSS